MRLVLILALAAVLAPAQSIQEKGRQVVDEAVAALGGPKFLSLQNKVEKGRVYSFQHREVSGLAKCTIYTKYLPLPADPDPKKVYFIERQAFGDNEAWYYQFTTDDAYEVTYRGARPMDEETVGRVRERRWRDVFYLLLTHHNDPGMIYEYQTTEVVDNQPLVKVDITDPANRVVSVWFHYTTKLPMRAVFQWRDEHRVPHEEVTIYDKYRDVGGGVMLPFVVQRSRDGERIFSLFAESVTINQPDIDTKFELPDAVKILQREK